MSHSHAYHRLLYRWLILLIVLIQLALPVSAAAMSWLAEPTQAPSAAPVVQPRNSSLHRAPGETRDAFFMRVGQDDPQRLQLAALRALEYYLNHPAPAVGPDDAFERLVEKYLALPVAMLGSAAAQLQIAGPPSPPLTPAPIVRAAMAPAPAPAQAATPPPTAPAATELDEPPDVADDAPAALDPPTVISATKDAVTSTTPRAATAPPTPMPTPELAVVLTPTATATSAATAAPTATRLPTRVASPAPTRPPGATAVAKPAAAPSRETRTVGVIKITADTFTDLGGGKTQAAGNVVIGDYLPLLGANDVVTYDASTLTATVTLALKVGSNQVNLFTGSISAPIGSGLATLGNDISYSLSKIAGFPISGNLVISQLDLAAAVVSGTASLRLNPPGVDTTASANFTITGASGGISYGGSLQAFSLAVAGVTLAVPQGATIGNGGVQAPSVTLTLPAIFGGLTTTVNSLEVTTDSLKLGGAQATFALPELRIGGGANSSVKFTNNQATLTFDDPTQAYLLTIASTLTLSLPSNQISVAASVTLGSSGGQPVLSGTLASLTLTVAGTSLAMSGLQISNSGLSVAQATLTLPAQLGGASGSVTQVSITKDGLGFGSATISLPDIKFGDGSKVKITGIQATLAQQNNQYVFSASATLQISLPGNARAIGLSLSVDGNGNISGTVTGTAIAADGSIAGPEGGTTLNLAGASLNLVSPTVSNNGISVQAATLTLPASLGSSSATVTGVTITKDGLSLGSATITFPDVKIGDGSKLKIAKISATMATATDGYTFSLSGTLQVRLPGNSQDITITGSINTSGQLSATVSQLTLNIASISLNMTGLSMNSSGLSVASATLNLPGKLGGASGGVSNVTITADGLKIGGATAQISFPDFKIGSSSGFSVTGVKATISITNDGSAYSVTLSGTIAVSIPGSSASATGSVTVDNLGNISGSVQSFSLTVAGLSLSAQNIQIASDGSFSISSARLVLPSGFGGGYVQLNNVVIRPGGGSNAVSIGSGSFQLPTISVGGFTLQVSGSLQQVTGGYQITASGLFNMPSLGGAGGCSGIQVSVTLLASASGQTVLEIEPAPELVKGPDWMVSYPTTSPAGLQLKQASLSLNCSLPIGDTGFFMTSLSGSVTLDENSTTVSVAVEIAAGKQVAGVAVASAKAQATVTADPFSLALSGTIKVFTFAVGGASASIKPSQFSATLWINAVVLQGQATVNAWSDTNGFHLTGTATMTVGIPQGAIVQKCWSWRCCKNGDAYNGFNCWPWKTHTCSACVCIPPSNWNVGSVSIQVGEFSTPSSGYAWGFKGEVTILGYSAAFYVDTNGTLKVGGDVNNYHLVTLSQLRAAQARWAAARISGAIPAGADWTDPETGVLFTASGEILAPVEMDNPRHASFEMTRFGGAPGLELIRPDGVRITPGNLPLGVGYTEVTTYTVAGEPELALAGVAMADLAPIVAPATATTVRAARVQDLVLANRFASRAGVDPSVRPAIGGVTSTEATTPTARLRFVHALAEVPVVDVLLDGAPLFRNIAYGAATPYVSVTAGSHVISIVPAGAASPELASVTASLGEGTDNTAVAIGRASSPALLALVDDNARPDRGKARVRVVHAAADAPAVDLALDTDSPTLFDIGYAAASETVPVDAGAHDLHVRSAGTTTDQLVVLGAPLADGRVYTVFVMGLREAATGPYALRAVLSQDAAPAGRVRFIHGVQAEANLDVLVDGQPLFTDVPFVSDPNADQGPYTPYAALAPGQHILSVAASGSPMAPLGALLLEVVSDQDTTVVAVPFAAALQADPAQGPVQLLWSVADNNALPALGQARVRLIHAWAQPQPIDLAVTGGATLIGGLGRYSASGYVTLPSGAYALEVRDTATGQVLATLPAEVLQEGLVHSVIVRDGAALPNAEATEDQVALRTTQATYEVDEPAAGTWQLVLTGDIGANDQYVLGVTGAVAHATLTGVTATPAEVNTAQVAWQLVSSQITTTVSIYANPGPIETTLVVTRTDGTTTTVTLPLFAGYPLVEKLTGDPPGWTNGSPQSQMVDLERLPSGTYHIWVKADDGRTRLAQVYATTVLTVTHPWAANWIAGLAAAPSYRTLSITWNRHPNPDIDRYQLKLGTQTGVAEQSVDIGDALSYRFTGLNPDQWYVIWMEGVDLETGRVSPSDEIRATPLGAPFTLAGPTGGLPITSGQAREITFTLSTTEAAYPDAVVLSAGCQPLTATAAAANECASVPHGIAVTLPSEPLTPTLAGLQVRAVISTASTLPDGLYDVPIVARGGGLERQMTIQLQAQRPYFQLSGAPAGPILGAQGTSVVQISTTGFHGTTDGITLALEDAPDGLQWAFGRTVIRPGEQTPLTLNDTELLGSGHYALRVIGNDGRVSDELALVLVVREPGFDIVAQPSKGEGVRGKAGAVIYELILSGRDGWTTPVTLSVAAAAPPPRGALRLSSVPVPGTGGPTLTVLPTGRAYAIAEWVADTPPGLYLFTVEAVSGAQSSPVNLALHIATALKWYYPIVKKQ